MRLMRGSIFLLDHAQRSSSQAAMEHRDIAVRCSALLGGLIGSAFAAFSSSNQTGFLETVVPFPRHDHIAQASPAVFRGGGRAPGEGPLEDLPALHDLH